MEGREYENIHIICNNIEARVYDNYNKYYLLQYYYDISLYKIRDR